MALPDTFGVQTLTAKTFKSSGGDAAITLASLAAAAARQSVKLDLGTPRTGLYKVKASVEMVATPAAGGSIDLYWAPSPSATAGTDNPGNVTGADAAYAGYSSDLTNTLPQLVFMGSLTLAARATPIVQSGDVGFLIAPPEQYGSLVVVNNGSTAFHSSDANCIISLIPLQGVVSD
jgi:hypothetical protein